MTKRFRFVDETSPLWPNRWVMPIIAVIGITMGILIVLHVIV